MRRAKSKLDKLDAFLLNLPDHDEPMLIEELDGFLTGVIVCPDMIMPSRWMPHIWSQSGSGEHAPVFDSMEQAQTITGLIMEHYNGIAKSLLEGRHGYEPVFAIDTRNDDVLWEMWAEGFARAMALSPASWLAIIESGDKAAIAALTGLQTFKALAGGESKLPKAEQDRLTLAAPDLIPDWVETLSVWRLTRAATRTAAVRPSYEKTSRNDPCPCGSGKKYKKCHGLN